MDENVEYLAEYIKNLSLITKQPDCSQKYCCDELDPEHLTNYNHKHLITILTNHRRSDDITIPINLRARHDIIKKQLNIIVDNLTKPLSESEEICKKTLAEKLAEAAPYNFFLSATITNRLALKETLSVSFEDLLDRSLGELEISAQINYCVDLPWVLNRYSNAGVCGTQLLLVYGSDDIGTDEEFSFITKRFVKPQGIGLNHTKLSLLGYKDGSMRVIVSTANLVPIDWSDNTQGLWISPALNKIDNETKSDLGESATGFRKDLIEYLQCYKIPELDYWIDRLYNSDCSAINVFLVCSVPGKYSLNDKRFGYSRLGDLLSQHVQRASSDDTIIAQSSSVGSFGPEQKDWAESAFLKNAFAPTEIDGYFPDFRFVFVTHKNVEESMGGCKETYGFTMCKLSMYAKQKWIRKNLCQWKAEERHRTKCMPHIKTYCRTAGPAVGQTKPKGLRWFLLTSANMSKNAWGTVPSKRPDTYQNNSFEMGVLFLPKFILGTDLLPLKNSEEGPAFSTPYDIPLTPYAMKDKMFFTDSQFAKHFQ